MQVFLWIVAVLGVVMLAGGVGLATYSRQAPLPQERLSAHPGPQDPGQHLLEGGVKIVLPLGDLPEGGIARLLDLIRTTSRTQELSTPDGHSFVTRSRLFGFPDITRIWAADGHLHIHSHLVIGTSDLGVNANRVRGWLKALQIKP